MLPVPAPKKLAWSTSSTARLPRSTPIERALYRDGLAAAHGKSAAEIEHTEFFETLRRHTIMGFLASPAWGGNRDKSGWKLIGFDDAGVFQPPFGYYDMPEHRG